MKQSTFCRITSAGLFCLGLTAVQAQSIKITGLVKDAQSVPIAKATVTLLCDGEGPAEERSTSTTMAGAYTFRVLKASRCTLRAAASGLTTSREVDLSSGIAGQIVEGPDLVLSAALRPLSNSSQTPAAPPTFEASGIRGLIDPGGYSAPANAAAASGILTGMADVRRGNTTTDGTETVPSCSAEDGLLRAIRLDPGSVAANRSVGEFYLAHGQAALALTYFATARRAAPLDMQVILDVARADIAQERFSEALAILTQIPTSISPTAHVLKAQADEGLGAFREAALEYELAEKQKPAVDNVFGQGYELILSGRPAEAGGVFERGLKLFPQAQRLLIGRGIAEFLSGRSNAALKTFLEGIALNSANPEGYPFLVQAYLVSGENGAQVRAALGSHVASSPGDGTAYYLQALALSRHDANSLPADDSAAENLLRKAVTLAPGLAPAHFRLGVLLARRGENDAAAQEFQYALHFEPTLAEAHYRLSIVDRTLGHTDDAAHELELFRKYQPADMTHDDNAGQDLRSYISVMHKGSLVPVAAACPSP